MIIINGNDYSNPYDESNDNKTKIKEWIAKIIKVLLACGNKNINNRNYKITDNNYNNNNNNN